jgi:hypothetical protein
VIDLERALFDVAEHLDHPAGDELADAVRRRVAASTRLADRSAGRSRSLVAIAAVFIVIVAAALAIPPSRHAIADWLGIGAIEVRRSGPRVSTGPGSQPLPGSPRSSAPNENVVVPRNLAGARELVDFTIATPHDTSAGTLARIEVDRRPDGGLLVLDYGRFTLVEVRANPEIIAKLIDRTATVERVSVEGAPGLWIAGAHEIAYQTSSRALATDTIRRSGPVLIWPRGGLTLRLEGFDTLAAAQKVAASIG